ncbi:MAG: cupin domain-containing protein [Candidatus Woesearchaeota archaeon]|nr:MAG: cupin domain-containing protein [Candidatus Woesearchaeota archaeon]
MQEFDAPFGKVQVFESNEKFGSSILVVEPGKEITPHFHKKTIEVEVILEGEVVCDGKIQKSGDINIWKLDQVHSYKNKSESPVKILCITVPPYDEADSFEVE